MNILSLSFGHDGLAAVTVDGKLVAAIASERLTRYKKQRGINRDTVNYVLAKAQLTWSQIHLVVITNWFWDHVNGRELYDKAAHQVSVTFPDGTPFTREQFLEISRSGTPFMGTFTFRIGAQQAPCVMVDHYLAHASYAFYMSPFDHALVASFDGGDWVDANHAVYFLDAPSKKSLRLRHGDFIAARTYAWLCDFLGFFPSLVDAGKVMALAAYGKPLSDIDRLAAIHPGDLNDPLQGDLFYHILLRAGIRQLPLRRALNPQLKGEGGIPDPDWLNKNDWRKEPNLTIAATAQAVLEKASLNLLSDLADLAKPLSRNLCLAGGTMLNCVNNGKILHSGLFDNVFVAPAAGDDGLAIGAALAVEYGITRDPNGALKPQPSATPVQRHSIREVFEGGRCYSLAEVDAAIAQAQPQLQAAGVQVTSPAIPELLQTVADHIAHDHIVGWFYRGSELGPRALGHRSILANPRNPDMKDILNKRVKHREEFRPFAPAILAEHAHEWFDLPPGTLSPFMLFSVACKKPDLIPSAVHIDGSARLQTVDPTNNGRFYDLIKTLHEKTGIPVVINTSFNVQGEPIVESPADAIRCFLGTQIDTLVLEDRLLQKPRSEFTL
jgi:carbamoyltransferase